MQKKTESSSNQTNPMIFAQNLGLAAQEWQQIIQMLTQQRTRHHQPDNTQDMLHISQQFMEATSALIRDPERLITLQMGLWQNTMQMWQENTLAFLGIEETHQAKDKDRRFKDAAWQESAVFNFIRESYMVIASWLQDAMQDSDNLDEHSADMVTFYTRQYTDAMAPSNFMMTNPEVLRATLESNGENLVKGLRNMRQDLERGNGKLNIQMTDENAFHLGENIATTPGEVIFQNDLMQLIQYKPTTAKVYKTPLLLIPAWINKYYILDLQPENSLIGWLVSQGHTVCVISWVNPDKTHSEKDFDAYLQEGPLAAMEAIHKATGEEQISVIGYCLGGTLLSILLAYLHAHGQSDKIASATYLTTMIDFEEPGELGVFIDEQQIKVVEEKMAKKGYLEASDMAMTFNLLRSNDLIWSFVINNYLLGKDPFPFDLLYWNADATRMPAQMHRFYLRNMYLENKLKDPGCLTILGTPIDLNQIQTPSYMLSCREDHIAPWQSTYAATQIFKGDITFTLAASGHIAGVINPPVKEKYCYWSAHGNHLPENPLDWQKEAKESSGSWWSHWHAWQLKTAGNEQVPARKIKQAIEPAPGSYVKVK